MLTQDTFNQSIVCVFLESQLALQEGFVIPLVHSQSSFSVLCFTILNNSVYILIRASSDIHSAFRYQATRDATTVIMQQSAFLKFAFARSIIWSNSSLFLNVVMILFKVNHSCEGVLTQDSFVHYIFNFHFMNVKYIFKEIII